MSIEVVDLIFRQELPGNATKIERHSGDPIQYLRLKVSSSGIGMSLHLMVAWRWSLERREAIIPLDMECHRQRNSGMALCYRKYLGYGFNAPI